MEQQFTLMEHLEELRKRLMIVIGFFIVALAVSFYFAPTVLQFIKMSESARNVEWNIFNYTDGIVIYLQCACVVALAVTLPLAMYHAWQFMKPGLSEKEQRHTALFIPSAFFLFLLGISFGYIVLFPIMMDFMQKVNQSIGATEMYGMKQYFSFMFGLLLPVATIFELPVVMAFLTKIGLVNATILRKSRKVAYFVLIIIGISITPPDFISDFLLIIPLIVLFEISVIISASIERKQRKRMQEMQQSHS